MNFISRHTRLTSLVGGLLTAAVAGCLVAFSLVAQRAALQSPGAPQVQPVRPGSDSGAPIDLGPFALPSDGDGDEDGGEPAPSPSAIEEIEALVALSEPSAGAPTDDPLSGPQPTPGENLPPAGPPRVPPEGPQDPADPCVGANCDPDVSRPAAGPTPTGGEGRDGCGGKGHQKARDKESQGKAHLRSKGKGRCGPKGGVGSARPSVPAHAGHGDEGPAQKGGPQDHGASGGGQGPKKPHPVKETHPGDSGPPDHAKSHGPPDHAKSQGPPAHAKGRGKGKGPK